MTSDQAAAQGQDQSDLFRGVSGQADLTESESIKGTPASRLPAFVLGEELADLADRDPRIVVLTADLASANRTVEFKARHPERFFDFGIAEKNMITAAAGRPIYTLTSEAARKGRLQRHDPRLRDAERARRDARDPRRHRAGDCGPARRSRVIGPNRQPRRCRA
jgi:hypothetical protein